MLRGKLFDDLTLGPARRRRRMHRRLRELDRLYASSAPVNSSSSVRPGRLRERLRTVFVALATAALVSGWIVLNYGNPLGEPPAVAHGAGTFRFTAHQPGSPDRPVAYDPCRPIEIVVNDSQAPDGADALLHGAVDEVSAATGLRLTVTGRTDDRLDRDRRHGTGDAPVLVDWTSPENVPDLAGDVAGLAGSVAVDTGAGGRRYVTGSVALDAPDLTEILQRSDGSDQVKAIIMHELGHLVGLDHVNDANELMNAENLGVDGFGPGDREGLAELGSGRCFPGL